MDEIEEMNLNEPSNRSSSCEITDTLCQGVHHEVSVEPTLRDMGLMVFSPTAIGTARSIHPKLRQTQPRVGCNERDEVAGLGDVQV